LELLYSLDNGVSWTNFIVANASADVGHVIISNAVPQVRGIVTTNVASGATNEVAVLWETTNNIDAIVLATNVIISCRVWDGKYWSDSVTSQPFIVDNEAPAVPATVVVTSHSAGIWSTNRTFTFSWSASDDGDGIGIGSYKYMVTNNYALVLETTNSTLLFDISDTAGYDGTNLWAAVSAVDLFGNSSDAVLDGPFMVDSIPPSSQLAVILVVTNEFGDYVLGSDVACSWSGFSENLSGISGYYASAVDITPTTNDNWIAGLSVTVSNTVQDQTNNIYVWAMDNVGLIGDSADVPVLVLSESGDFDGDSLNNGQENIAGTDASDADSVFSLDEEILTTTSNSYVVLSWDGVTNRFYTLFASSNLNNIAWDNVPSVSNMPGVNGVMLYTNKIDILERRFYKVNVGR
jgi:hypothetical protein